MKFARYALLLLVLTGCSKTYQSEFSVQDPLHYVQSRPVAPFTASIGDTGSMAPTLSFHDVVRVTPDDIRFVQIGDLVCFWWGSRQIPAIHRVVDKFIAGDGEIGLKTRGDANSFPDDFTTTQADLIGRVTILSHR